MLRDDCYSYARTIGVLQTFRTLAAVSGWNNEALLGVFMNALNEHLKDELTTRETLTPLFRWLLGLTTAFASDAGRGQAAHVLPVTLTFPHHIP